MTVAGVVSHWQAARLRAFVWRRGLSIPGKLVLCLAMAGFTGLMAQVRIVLPFTPVPMTGQVFAVLLAGALLGRNYGAMSQVMYLALGSAGVGWFAGATGGLPLGPSGGYIIGFIPAAALVGWFSDRRIRMRGVAGQTLLMLAAVAIIYAAGAVQFAVVMHAGFGATMSQAVLPFILIDIGKAFGVALVTSSLLPKAAFGVEQAPGDPDDAA